MYRRLIITAGIALGLLACGESEDVVNNAEVEESGTAFVGAADESDVNETGETLAVEDTQRASGQTDVTVDEVQEEVDEPGEVVEVDEEVTEEVNDSDFVSLDDLTAEDLAEIDVLRENIFAGISVGEDLFIKQVNLALEDLGLYNGETVWNADETLPDVSTCPFVEYYNNTKPLSEASCEYLVDQARSDAYSKLAAVLQTERENFNSTASEQDFWYEQGAISGLEKTRVVIRVQMKTNDLCNQTPVALESSYEKGLVVGRQHFINTMNNWLTTNGYKADYPVMSEPIEVCDANASLLDPVYDESVNTISQAVTQTPLCNDFQPTDLDEELMYGQAMSDFSMAVEKGVEDEFALAAVKIFEVVPCNVSDPLIVDMNMNQKLDVTSLQEGVNFSITGKRVKAVAWLDGDGFLFVDINNNGIADDGTEFFGTDSKYSSGFAHLSFYDSNRDNRIDHRDRFYSRLNVWVDENSDGVSTRGEVISAKDMGMTIPVTSTEVSKNINGSILKSEAWATSSKREKILMGDVDLRSGIWQKSLAFSR